MKYFTWGKLTIIILHHILMGSSLLVYYIFGNIVINRSYLCTVKTSEQHF